MSAFRAALNESPELSVLSLASDDRLHFAGFWANAAVEKKMIANRYRRTALFIKPKKPNQNYNIFADLGAQSAGESFAKRRPLAYNIAFASIADIRLFFRPS